MIAGSYLVSPTLGVSTTVAVLAHELPQELGDLGVLVHSGVPARRAVLWNLASAAAAMVGATLVLVLGAFGAEAVTSMLVPVAAGGFVYIAAADLIPELQRERTLVVQLALVVAGVAVMAVLTLWG